MNGYSKKIIATLLICAISASLYAPWTTPRASAGPLLVVDIMQYPKEFVLDVAVKLVLKTIAKSMVNRTKEWLRTGDAFRGGGPLFITNFDRFVWDAVDRASGNFLNAYRGTEVYNFLCTPFRDPIFRSISRSFPRHGYSSKDPLASTARCSINTIVQDVERFYQNFENGGWEAWAASALFQNNPSGLRLLAREEKFQRETRAAKENRHDFETGSGFIASQICVEEKTHELVGPTQDGQPLTGTECVRTLKESIGSAVKANLESDFAREWLGIEIADEFQEIIFAALDGMLSMVMQGAGGLLTQRPDFEPTRSEPYTKSLDGNPNTWRCDINHGGGTASATGGGGGADGQGGGGGSASVNIAIVGTDDCSLGPPTPFALDIPPDPSVGSPGITITQCNDRVDNDGDGLIDYPNDPQCTSALDTTESDVPTTNQCTDGIDNDLDGFIDAADPQCVSGSTSESGGGPPPLPDPPPSPGPPGEPGEPPIPPSF